MLIIGIGNLFRCDDAVGLLVARRLHEKFPSLPVYEFSGDGMSLIETWRNHNQVVVIDALQTGGDPGTIYRFDPAQQKISSELFACSTHSFSLADAIDMAQALGELPEQMVIYGIESQDFSYGQELTPEVAKAIPEAVARIAREVKQGAKNHA